MDPDPDPLLNDIFEAQVQRPLLLQYDDEHNWSFDWRYVGGVSPLKDQGQAGCCWCFPVVDSVETASFQATGVLRILSVQQLLDSDRHNTDCVFPCTRHSSGCEGGFFDSAFTWIVENGLQEERNYPRRSIAGYTSMRGAPRRTRHDVWTARISSFTEVPYCDELALGAAVVRIPVAVSVRMDDAFNRLLYDEDAIFQRHVPRRCRSYHSLLIVGLGVEDGIPYWSVKNSYGNDWGYGGYLKMLRNYHKSEGLCGIARGGVYPII